MPGKLPEVNHQHEEIDRSVQEKLVHRRPGAGKAEANKHGGKRQHGRTEQVRPPRTRAPPGVLAFIICNGGFT